MTTHKCSVCGVADENVRVWKLIPEKSPQHVRQDICIAALRAKCAELEARLELHRSAEKFSEDYRVRAVSAEREAERLRDLISRPYIGAWLDEVLIEAAYQRDRWGAEHDTGKESQDWFWLVGYLAGKCLRACIDGDWNKARHHTVSTAAVLANWAAAISGDENVMRPGIGSEKLISKAKGAV